MAKCSFLNLADDFRTQLQYTAAAEFIYRLDAFLESEHTGSETGSLPLETIAAVHESAEAALVVSKVLGGEGEQQTRFNELLTCMEAARTDNAHAAKVIASATCVLKGLLEEQQAALASLGSHGKAQLMYTLASEFFLRFGVITEKVMSRARGVVSDSDVALLRGCLDSAMGMLHELNEADWLGTHDVPARAIIAVRQHVISWRLECDGPEAVHLMQEVYDAVEDQVMAAA